MVYPSNFYEKFEGMAKKSFLDIWGVPTFLPLFDVESLAVRFWAHYVLTNSGSKPDQFVRQYCEDSFTGKKLGSFYLWKNHGTSAPQFFYKDGSEGFLIKFEKEFPGSYRFLKHPGWTIMSGPQTLSSCNHLLMLLSPEVSKLASKRHYLPSPQMQLPTQRDVNHITVGTGKYYTFKYQKYLLEIGSLDAFFAYIALEIEFHLNLSGPIHFGPYFKFDPKDWKFCKTLPSDMTEALFKRCAELHEVCIAINPKPISSIEIAANQIKEMKRASKSYTEDEMKKFLETALNTHP